MAEPIHVTDSTFEAEVLHSDLPVLIDFWASWCGPCLMIAPELEKISEEYEGRLKVTKLDVDRNQATAAKYGVQSIPTLLLFKNGQPVERMIGYMKKEKLMEKIEPHL
ncbi:MAG: thioredoxin [Anaerolineae bacterium]